MTLLHSFAQLAGKMFEAEARMQEAEEIIVRKACAMLEIEARAELGTYQPAAGPFPAWSPLADSTLADKAAKGYGTPDPLLRTGELRDSIGHTIVQEGGDTVGYVGTNGPVAKFQEFGTSKMPARSFLGGAVYRKEAEIVDMARKVAVAAVGGGGESELGYVWHVLHRVYEKSKDDIEEMMDDSNNESDRR